MNALSRSVTHVSLRRWASTPTVTAPSKSPTTTSSWDSPGPMPSSVASSRRASPSTFFPCCRLERPATLTCYPRSFLSSDKKSQILPHMPEQKRKFVHDLAAIYRMDTQMVDQEPHRSVQLIRRIDSRIPNPTLSAAIGQASGGGLGKLADLRSPGSGLQPLSRPGSSRASPAPVAQPAAGPSAGRGWTSVVTRPPQATSPAPSSWGATPERAKTPVRSVPSPAPVRTTPVAAPAPLPATQPLSPQDVPDDWEDAA